MVGTAVEAKSMGFGGELKVLVGFDAEGKIYNYSLLAHTETPGLVRRPTNGSVLTILPRVNRRCHTRKARSLSWA